MDEESDALEAYERELYEMDESSDDEDDDTKEVEEMLYRNIHYAPCLEGDLPVSDPKLYEESDKGKKSEKNKKYVKRYYDTEDLSTMKCFNCDEMGHRATDCTKEKKKIVCYKCYGTGHFSRDCPDLVCFTCNEQGHYSRDCKNRKCRTCNEVGHIAKFCTAKLSPDAPHSERSKNMLDKFGDYCKDVRNMVKKSLTGGEELQEEQKEKGKSKSEKTIKKQDAKKKSKSKSPNDTTVTSEKNLKSGDESSSTTERNDKSHKKKSDSTSSLNRKKNLSIIEIESDSVGDNISDKEPPNIKKKKSFKKKETIDLVSEESDSCEVVKLLESNSVKDSLVNTNSSKGFSPFSDLYMDKSLDKKKKEHSSTSKSSKDTVPDKTVKLKDKVFNHQTTLNDLRNILRDSADEDLSDSNFANDDLPNINVDSSDSENEIKNGNNGLSNDDEGSFSLDYMNFSLDATHYDPTEVDVDYLASYGLSCNSTSTNGTLSSDLRHSIKGKKSTSKLKAYSNSPGIKKNDIKKKAKKIYMTKMKKHFKNAKTNNDFLIEMASTKRKSPKKTNVVHRNSDFNFRNVKKNVIVLD